MLKKIVKKFVYSFPSSIVLMLHDIWEETDEKTSCGLSRDRFEALLCQFNNWTSLDDIIENKTRKRICLTFDDGNADIYSVVYPLCKEKNIPITLFITYNLLDTDGHLTKEQLIELSKSPLVTIGSHDMNHVPLPNLSYDEQERELVDSKKMIEELIGLPVKYLAYPYGQHNKDTLRILNNKKLYSRAFVAGGLCYNWIMAKRIYKLPRLYVADSTYERCISNIKKYTT